jgi:hypothetical protein
MDIFDEMRGAEKFCDQNVLWYIAEAKFFCNKAVRKNLHKIYQAK